MSNASLRPGGPRLDPMRLTGAVPFVAVLVLWALVTALSDIPAYKLPSPLAVWQAFWSMTTEGRLGAEIWASLGRLAGGYLLGNLIAIPLGLAIALNRAVAETVTPVLSFFQAIAGIAWVPLAIIWFGIGQGSVLFVIANTVFFASIYSTVVGVRSIPTAFYRAAACHGANRWHMITSVVVPGALVQVLVGLRTSMAYGWRALVAAEMIAGTNGIGYMTLEAVRWFQTEIVLLGMILIGALWLALDLVVFRPIERATVRRWGILA